jgi:hypothetical protein
LVGRVQLCIRTSITRDTSGQKSET